MAGLMRCAVLLSMTVLGSGGGVAWASPEWPGVVPATMSDGSPCVEYLPEGLPRGEVVLRSAELDMRFDAAFADVAPPIGCLEPQVDSGGPDRGESRSLPHPRETSRPEPSRPEMAPPGFRPGGGYAEQVQQARPGRPPAGPTVALSSERPVDRHSGRRAEPLKVSPAHPSQRSHKAHEPSHAPAVTPRRNGERETAARSAEAGGGRTRGARAVHGHAGAGRSTGERGREAGGIAARPPRAAAGEAVAGPVGLTEMAHRRPVRERRGVLDELPLTSLGVLGLLIVLIVQMRLYLKRAQKY